MRLRLSSQNTLQAQTLYLRVVNDLHKITLTEQVAVAAYDIQYFFQFSSYLTPADAIASPKNIK